MKFINSKKIVDYANELAQVQKDLAKANAKVKELKEQEDSLITFLAARSRNEPFQFTGSDDYVMLIMFNESERFILDQQRARALLTKLGKKVPMKRSTWVSATIRHATEEEVI